MNVSEVLSFRESGPRVAPNLTEAARLAGVERADVVAAFLHLVTTAAEAVQVSDTLTLAWHGTRGVVVALMHLDNYDVYGV